MVWPSWTRSSCGAGVAAGMPSASSRAVAISTCCRRRRETCALCRIASSHGRRSWPGRQLCAAAMARTRHPEPGPRPDRRCGSAPAHSGAARPDAARRQAKLVRLNSWQVYARRSRIIPGHRKYFRGPAAAARDGAPARARTLVSRAMNSHEGRDAHEDRRGTIGRSTSFMRVTHRGLARFNCAGASFAAIMNEKTGRVPHGPRALAGGASSPRCSFWPRFP